MADRKGAAQCRYIVPALAQGLGALALFSRECPSLTPPEIAQAMSLSRATVFRMLNTLESLGYLVRESDGRRFRLGPAVLGRGFAYLASFDLVEIAQPILQQLRDEAGMSTHMAIRDGAEIVYVSRFAARTTIASSVQVGTRFPAHATAMGRVLACELGTAELAALYPRRELRRYSEQTPKTLEAFRRILKDDRDRGFVVSQSFFERGVCAIAAPVRDKTNMIVAAINATSVDSHVTIEDLNGNLKDLVLAAAAKIGPWLSTGKKTNSRFAT